MTQEKEEKQGASLSKAIVTICNSCEVWLSEDKCAFVSIKENHKGGEHIENWPIYSQEAVSWIRFGLHKLMSKSPRKSDIEETQSTLAAFSLRKKEYQKAHLRIALHNHNLYIDLGTPEWSAVEITQDGWEIISIPPVKFRRASNMQALPTPKKGGSIELLQKYLNTKSREDFLLLVSWLIAAYSPTGPYPILVLTGSAGSAKSSAARALLSFVNASQISTQAPPKDEKDLMIMAEHNVAVCFDNGGSMKGWLPNALCRLSTGSGLSTRTLYENKGMTFFGGARPIILTAIDSPSTQTDLIDRMIQISLKSISDFRRLTERQIQQEANNDSGLILGAIFDILSVVLMNLDNIDHPPLPRMADFAYWVLCAEEAIGWEHGQFLDYYELNKIESFGKAIDQNAVASAVTRLMQVNDKWEGTASELIIVLKDILKTSKGVPKNPANLSAELNRLSVALRREGIEIETGIKTPGGKSKLIRINLKPKNNCDAVTVNSASFLENSKNKNKENNIKNGVPSSQNKEGKNHDEY